MKSKGHLLKPVPAKIFQPTRLKVKSAIGNSVIANLSIAFFWYMMNFDIFAAPEIYLSASFVAFCFGWAASGWYKKIPNSKWNVRPYLVTTLISFPTAVCAFVSLSVFIALALGKTPLPTSSSDYAFIIFAPLMAAGMASPVSLSFGALLGWYLTNGPAEATVSRESDPT